MSDASPQAKAQNTVTKAKSTETTKNNYALPGFILSWVVFAAILTMVPNSQELTAGGKGRCDHLGYLGLDELAFVRDFGYHVLLG
ncbi:MAG: hypothetical protein AB1538_06360 [Bacillota bacterium]|uniref:hypothetical protein n=1 Tax=Desulforamulus profundi TaxID=1383067 RepID=UPI001177C1EA|nr:hypothetical protein [Desulforamulus profundi]